ncbi:heme peroxidase-related protein, partial [Haematococcus lacustris]
MQQLLAAGHTVHATVRNPGHEGSVAHLKALPGAEQRLRLFKADLLAPGSFYEAVQGCTVVFHTASPFIATAGYGEQARKAL